jgi:hypothetical protein
MKTIEKQDFAKLLLNIYSNFLRSYQYDSFYDIVRLRKLEEKNESIKFHIYFRRSGSDLLFDNEPDNVNLHKAYMQRNNLVLYISYISNIDKNSDTYNIETIKDQYDFLYAQF